MGLPECLGCQRCEDEIAALQAEVAALTCQLDELLRRTPPPAVRPQRRYPPAPGKQPSRKKPGGPPGHSPHLKQLAPPQRVQRIFVFVPERGAGCQASLPPASQPGDPPPVRLSKPGAAASWSAS
jgi:hypothetical protein